MGWMETVQNCMGREKDRPNFESPKCPRCERKSVTLEWNINARRFEVDGETLVYNQWMECSNCLWVTPVEKEDIEEADRYEWTETRERSAIDLNDVMEETI